MSAPERAPQVAVGAVVRRNDELLLVRRARPPAAGTWSVPGGRVRFGESLEAALRREVAEETGLRVTVGELLGWTERRGDDPEPYHFVILDFEAVPVDARVALEPGDDAELARWVPRDEVAALALAPGLGAFLRRVGVLPPHRP